jgi:hypothetical protein
VKIFCHWRQMCTYRTSKVENVFFLIACGGVKLSPLGTLDTIWSTVPTPHYRSRLWSIRWNDNWLGKQKYSEKTCPGSIFPPQIPHYMTWHGIKPGPPRWEAGDKSLELWHGLCKYARRVHTYWVHPYNKETVLWTFRATDCVPWRKATHNAQTAYT